MNELRVALVQFNIEWRNKSTNFRTIERLVDEQVKADLILLPEMFQTGFAVKHPEEAEGMDGPTIQWMKQLGSKQNAAVAGSLMILDEGQLTNRFVVVDAQGVLAYYDKQHLFKLSAEGEHFHAGTNKVDVNIKGFRCRLIVCYDLRFPYSAYNDSNYDVLLVCANWPVQRIKHWDCLLQARAIENQAYVCAANRVGVDPFQVQYPGHSSVHAPDGSRLARFTGEEVQVVVLKRTQIEQVRKSLPFLNDQRA